MSKLCAALAVSAGAAAFLASPASAGWMTTAGGGAAAKASSMPTGAKPSASVSQRDVTVSWSQRTLGAGAAVNGYVVKRYSNDGTPQSIGSGCDGTVSGLSCTETSVPPGSWRYAVVPKHGNWLGTEGAQSDAVTVVAPSFSLSSSSVTSLPATLGGNLTDFATGQTVTYRLDNAATGTVLTATTTPNSIPGSGNANASVTIPAGTSNGDHTIYAIGSGGDVASASVTVNVALTTTIGTSAWDIRDASAGAAEANATAATAAADARTFATATWTSTFGTKHLEFDMNNALASAATVSNATFNFRFAAAAAGEQACFYFELRRISTGAVISTHGSAATPVQCVTGTTQTTVSTPMPQLTTGALANDTRIRVYARESASKLITVDMATVTGTASGTAFTQHALSYVDAAAATPTTTRWGPAVAGDSAAYSSAANWAAAFSSSRYLKFTFPAYVPSGATVTGATLKNYYRPTASGRNACWYFEVYAGTTLIATHGSTVAPVSCNSTSTYTTDSIALPSVNTPARANSLVVRAYYNISGSGTRTTQHDLVNLSVDYTQ